jgi:hypothetical protein
MAGRTKRERINWTRAAARAVLEEAARSGLSLRAFALREGIRPRRLYWWKKELASDAGVQEPGARLVPAVVTDRRETKRLVRGAVVVHGGDTPAIEIREPHEVAPAWVAALLRELERGA